MKQILEIRLVRFGFLPLLVLLLVLGVTGFAAAQSPVSLDAPKGPHGMIPELQGIPPDQLFDHFHGSQFTITDAQGNVVIYQMTPGTIAEVTVNGLTVTPNGAAAPMSFNVTPTTTVQAMPAAGSLQAVVQGDKVVILTRQGSSDAVSIMEHRIGMYHGSRMMMQ